VKDKIPVFILFFYIIQITLAGYSMESICSYVYSPSHFSEATTVFFYQQNISDNHPAVEILRNLENTAHYVDKNLSGYVLTPA
jgi:hypothetical protein